MSAPGAPIAAQAARGGAGHGQRGSARRRGRASPGPDASLAARVGELAHDLGVELEAGAPLAPLTWLGIGGPTPFLLTPRSAEAIPPLVSGLASLGLAPLWLGAGSNLLIDDRGLEQPVVSTRELRGEPEPLGGGRVRALAGTALPGFTRWLAGRGLAGLEFAEGIPGSVGGAVAMNAGAFGMSVGDRAARVVLLHARGGLEERDVVPGDFSYRRSAFAEAGDLVLAAVFKLGPGDAGALGRQLEEYRRHRRETQPLSEQSAGCIFKNPLSGPGAGALIESCGLKGRARGGAEVSGLHANFVLNHGGASFADVRGLVEDVKEQVLRRTGVLLEEEIRVWSRS